jgi:tRNA threonylcarbamoyladenosine biosynthesis protein TsaE
MNRLELVSKDAEQTENIAHLIGARLRGGEVIELVSDLGGGKTTFTRGLADGAGSKDIVASPTFIVSKVYTTPTLEIHHFDFYRLGDAGLIAHEIHDLLDDLDVVLVVEWGGVVEHVLPDDRITITITRTGDDLRALIITYDDSKDYLLEDLC